MMDGLQGLLMTFDTRLYLDNDSRLEDPLSINYAVAK